MYRLMQSLFLLVGLSLFAAPAFAQPIQGNTDRPGLDYTNVTLPPGSVPKDCQALCTADAGTCKAWTFVKANVQDVNPRCWLKTAIPAPVPDPCCASGVWAAHVEPNFDRRGGDFANVALPAGSQPAACRALCDADGTCQSWTFVKAGVQSANPRCWIKDSVPPAEASNCCTSGVKHP